MRTKNNPYRFQCELQSMTLGTVREINGHRVQRVATGFMIDERFAWSARQYAECLLSPLPCKPAEPTPIVTDFDNP